MLSQSLSFHFVSGSQEIAEARKFHDAMPPEGHMFGCEADGCDEWDMNERYDRIFVARRNGRLVAVMQIEGDNCKLVDDSCAGCLAIESGPERNAIITEMVMRLVKHLEKAGTYRNFVISVQLGKGEVAFLENLGFVHGGDYVGNHCFMERKLNLTPRKRNERVDGNVHYLDF